MEGKERQRYILFKIISDKIIEQNKLISTIWRNIFQLFGETGTSKTGLWLAEYDAGKQYGILRTHGSTLQMVRTTLAIIRKVENTNCILVSIGVSGTIHALKEKHLKKINLNEQ